VIVAPELLYLVRGEGAKKVELGDLIERAGNA